MNLRGRKGRGNMEGVRESKGKRKHCNYMQI